MWRYLAVLLAFFALAVRYPDVLVAPHNNRGDDPLASLAGESAGDQFCSPHAELAPRRLRIPSLDLNIELQPSAEPSALEVGPGIWSQCPDHSVIAGHRTTHAGPFHDLGQLQPGDQLQLDRKAYTVDRIVIVTEAEAADLFLSGEGLTLFTCTCEDGTAGCGTHRIGVIAHA